MQRRQQPKHERVRWSVHFHSKGLPLSLKRAVQLKKQQKKKAAGGDFVSSPTVSSPVLPPSRTSSPAPSEVTLTHPPDPAHVQHPLRTSSPASELTLTNPVDHKSEQNEQNVGDL